MRDYIDNPIKVRSESSSSAGTIRRPLLVALGLCSIAIVLLLLDIQGYLTPLRGLFGHIIRPVAQPLMTMRAGSEDLWDMVTSVPRLHTEYAALQQEHSQLQDRLVTYERVLVENERLRQQLAIQEEHPWHLLGADVLIRSPDAGRRVLTIARGSADDVQEGMAVVGQTGSGPVALVGIIEAVYGRTSSVLLITDFGSRISARVLRDGAVSLGLVQGQWQRGSRLRLEQLENEQALVQGAVVVSAGLTNALGFDLPLAALPPDVPIGEIENVRSEGANQFAELRPYVDPDQVRYVWVILSQEN